MASAASTPASPASALLRELAVVVPVASWKKDTEGV